MKKLLALTILLLCILLLASCGEEKGPILIPPVDRIDANTDSNLPNESDTDTSTEDDSEVTTDTDSSTEDTDGEGTDASGGNNSDTNANTDTSIGTDTEIDSSEHKHTEELIPAVEPTCTETGLTEGKKCSTCGEILLEQETIDTIEHNYLNKVCAICGEKAASQGFIFKLDSSTNTYSITKIGDCIDADIVIPNEYEGLPVTSIGDFAFQNCTWIRSVTIGENITSIGMGAFKECISLATVTIGENVKSIKNSAFVD